MSEVDIQQLKEWFNKTYPNDKARVNGFEFKRQLNWNKAADFTSEDGISLKWIPVDYEDENRPGIVTYNDKVPYFESLKNNYFRPTIEGFVIFSSENKFQGYLTQIAYDPYVTDNTIDKKNFTGSLILSEYNGDIKLTSECLNGVTTGFYDSTKSNNGGRLKDWVIIWQTYQTVNVGMNVDTGIYDWTVTQTTSPTYVWIAPGNTVPSDATFVSSDFNYFGGGGGASGGGSYAGYFSNGLIYNPPPIGYDFNAIVNGPPNGNRDVAIERLNRALTATGLVAGISSFTYDKALLIVKQMGIDLTTLYADGGLMAGKLTVLGRSIGGLSVAISTGQFIMGITDGKDFDWWGEDGINLLQIGLGVAALAVGGWIGVTIGGVSVVIAIAVQ